jgi:hypothetical protein
VSGQRADLHCRAAVRLVTDLIEGGLPPGDQVDLELHLVACEGCSAVLQRMRTTIGVLRALPAPEPPDVERLVGSVLDRLRAP